jgi:hypothetical protein
MSKEQPAPPPPPPDKGPASKPKKPKFPPLRRVYEPLVDLRSLPSAVRGIGEPFTLGKKKKS